MIYFKKILLVVLTATITGCASSDFDKSREQRLEDSARTSAALERARHANDGSAVETTDLYIGPKTPFEVRTESKLPERFSRTVTLTSAEPVTIGQVLGMLTKLYGIRSFVEPNAMQHIGGIDAGATPLDGGGQSGGGGQGSQQQGGMSGGGMGNSTQYRFPLKYTGPISGLLDHITAKMNVFWEYTDDGRLHIYRDRTETYFIEALAGVSQFSGGVSGSESESAGSSLEASIQANGLSVWDSVQADVEAMLSASGGVVAVSPTTGAVTVTDTPRVLRNIGQYVEQMNKRLNAQVSIEVQVLEVTTNRSRQYGIDWNAVYERAGEFGLSFVTQATDSDLAGTLAATVLDPGSRFVDSQMFVRALSAEGDVSVAQTATVTTLSGHPIPLKAIREDTYLARSSVTNTADVGTTAQLEPGVVTSGFYMNLLPRVSGNEVILQMAIELSTLEEIVRVEVGDSAIEQPKKTIKNFVQQVRMDSGELLVVTGFEQDENGEEYEGMLPAMFGWLGGQETKNLRKTETVILIRPRITRSST